MRTTHLQRILYALGSTFLHVCKKAGLPVTITMLLLQLAPAAFAQSITIQGKVSSGGNPLPGAVVRVAGGNAGATTDADGFFKLAAPANGALVFTLYGYKPETVQIDNRTNIDMILQVDPKSLEEVVVVGYGTQKKVNLTGAVATVGGSELLKRPITNPVAMLQGTMPGVQITQGTGEPGNENTNIRIRGTGTFSGAGVDPLVLIDGVEGKLSDVNPNNIENISVLKDAASAAIYGARAANGVVLVTTKQGVEGKLRVQYDFNYGLYKATKLFDLITNSAEYMELFNEARINSGLSDPNGLYTQQEIDAYKNATDRVHYPNTDWLSYIFQTAPTQTHNLNFSGGRNGTVFDASVGYVNQEGIMKGFNYKKYNARLNMSSQINKRIRFGANIAFKYGQQERPVFGSEDMFLSAMAQAPTYGPYLTDGSGHYTYKAYDLEYNNKNPVAVLDGKIRHNTDDYGLMAQGWVEVQLLKGLSWYTKAAVNGSFNKYKDFRPPLQLYNFHTNAFMTTLDLGGGLEVQDEQTIYTNVYSYLNYERTLGNGHNFKLQAGYSGEKSTYQYLKAARKQYSVDFLTELDAGSPAIQYANGTQNTWALTSFFGRLGYNYKERYLFEANMRYDGSSRLTPSSRWGVFPSFSAGWRATEEDFIKNLQLSWLDNFKLRGSWGQLGNQNIGNYPYQAILDFTGNYSFDDASLTSGVAQTSLPNPGIKWETTTVTDLGIDLSIFQGFNLTADWYKKRTKDILRPSQITGAVGMSAPTINDGVLDNTGVELGLSYSHTVKNGGLKGLSYTIGGNVEHYKNKLVQFGAQAIDGYRIRKEGEEIDSYYMLDWIGIFQSEDEIQHSPKQYADATIPGDLKFRDANGDGVVNDNDRVLMKGNFPTLNYALNLSLQWKGFDFYAMAQGVDGTRFFVSEWGTIPFVQGAPPTTDWRNRWTETNHSTTMPRIYWGWSAPDRVRRASSYYLQDASYLRLKNLTLGYTIPASITQRAGIESLRVYFSGDNLLTATKYRGLDPERAGSGNLVQYPQNKIYSFGVNVKF